MIWFGKIVEDTGLTRKTIIRILQGIKPETFNQFKENPEDFVIKASSLINDQKATAIIQHITYDLLDEAYDTEYLHGCDNQGSAWQECHENSETIFLIIWFSIRIMRRSLRLTWTPVMKWLFMLNCRIHSLSPHQLENTIQTGRLLSMKETSNTFISSRKQKGSMNSLQLREVEKSKIECARRAFQSNFWKECRLRCS